MSHYPLLATLLVTFFYKGKRSTERCSHTPRNTQLRTAEQGFNCRRFNSGTWIPRRVAAKWAGKELNSALTGTWTILKCSSTPQRLGSVGGYCHTRRCISESSLLPAPVPTMSGNIYFRMESLYPEEVKNFSPRRRNFKKKSVTKSVEETEKNKELTWGLGSPSYEGMKNHEASHCFNYRRHREEVCKGNCSIELLYPCSHYSGNCC